MNQIDVNSTDRDDVAAAWVARLDRGSLAPDEQTLLDRWLASDSRHRGAFARAQASLAYLHHAGALSDDLIQEATAPGAAAVAFVPSRRRRLVVLGGAVAAAASLALLFWPTAPAAPQLIQSQIGEIRLVSLSDDSILTLNTHSIVTVDYSASRRSVRLVDGEASFSVAHDRSRPFAVAAGDLEVVAVGTSFTTRNLAGRPVEVLVQDGVVDVFYKGKHMSVRADANSKVTVAEKDGVAHLVKQAVDPATLARETAWLDGMIAFEGVTLKDAAAEFARYSAMRIVVEDVELQKKKITGLFSVHNPYRFSRAVAGSLGLQLDVAENELRLRH